MARALGGHPGYAGRADSVERFHEVADGNYLHGVGTIAPVDGTSGTLAICQGGDYTRRSGGTIFNYTNQGSPTNPTWAHTGTSGAESATSVTSFTINSGSTTGKLKLTGTSGGTGAYTVELKTTAPTGNRTVTIQDGTGTLAFTSDVWTDVDLGSSGVAGSLDVFPGTAARGKLRIVCANNAADWTVTLTNKSHGQASSYAIPDCGAAAGQIPVVTSDHFVKFVAAADSTVTLPATVTIGGTLDIDGAFTVNCNAAARTLDLTGNVTIVGDFATAAAVSFTGANAISFTTVGAFTYTLPLASGTLALATGAETGTTSSSFTLDQDAATGQLKFQVNAVAGSNHTVTIQASTTTQNCTITIPDAATDTFALLGATQTLAAKTLTAPVINGCTTAAAANNFTLHTGSGAFTTPTGTFTHYGNVANNGNISFDFSASNSTFKTSTGTNTLGGDVVISGAKTLMTGTGAATLKGSATFDATKTLTFGSAAGGTASVIVMYSPTAAKGGFILSPTDNATDHAVTLTNGAANGGNVTITTPAATCTLAGINITNTFSIVQNFTINDAFNSAVTDLMVLTHATSGDPSAGMGAGISVIIENDTDATTEVGGLDWVITNDGTKATLDVDVVFSVMLNGAMQPAVTIDASDQSLAIGQNVTDPDGLRSLRLFPVTTAKGSLLVTSIANTGDTVLEIQNAAQGQGTTLKIPDCGSANGQFVLTQADQKVIITTGAADRTITMGGNWTSAGALNLGDHNLTLNTTAATELTLPTTGTVGTLAGNETYTNKAIDSDSNTITNIAPDDLKAAVVGVRGGAVPVIGVSSALVFQFDATAGSVTWTNATGDTVRIVGISGRKTNGAGGAGDTIRVYSGANPITDALTLNGMADGTRFAFTTEDDAYVEVANGGTIVVTSVKGGATNPSCEVNVDVVRV